MFHTLMRIIKIMGIREFIEHMILVCALYEGERVSLFQAVGEVFGEDVGG